MSLFFKRLSTVLMILLLNAADLTLLAETVRDIRIDQSPYEGQRELLPENILWAYIFTRTGREYDEKTVNEDITALIESGFADDVKVFTEPCEDGVRVVYVVRPPRKIAKIVITGNEKYSQDELMKLVTLKDNNYFNAKKLSASIEAIRAFYDKKGYRDVIIRDERTLDEDGRIVLTLAVDEGLKRRVYSVNYENNTVYSKRKLNKLNLNNAFSLAGYMMAPFSWFDGVNPYGMYNESLLDNDKEILREAYWEKGYLDFEIVDVRVTPRENDPEWVDIVYVFDEGEPYTVTGAKIDGVTQFIPSDLEDMIHLKAGDRYNGRTEMDDVAALRAEYYKLGFDNVQLTIDHIPDPVTHEVFLHYVVSEGEREFVRRIEIVGNEVTHDYVILRELPLQPGDPFDRTKIEKTKDRLSEIGLFDDMQAYAVRTEEPQLRDITLNVQERDYIKIGAGASISDVNSLAGMISLQHRNFDILDFPDENSQWDVPTSYFSGAGQTLDIMGMYGIETAQALIRFTEPWLFGIPLRFNVEGYFRNRYYDDWAEQYLGVEVSLGKTLDFIDDYTYVQVAYKFEHVRIYDMNKKFGPEFKSQVGGEFVSSPTLILSHNTIPLRERIDPRWGHEVVLLGSITPSMLGSTSDFFRVELKASQYVSFFDDAIRAMVGFKIGAVPSFGDTNKTPLFARYFLGGGDTIRGFPYRSVGPVDADDHVFGGEFMYLLTAEISHPIWEFIRGAVFIDIGDATDGSFKVSEANIGMGYGLRIKIPGQFGQSLPPLKIDLAYPIRSTQPNVERKLRVHFDMGISF